MRAIRAVVLKARLDLLLVVPRGNHSVASRAENGGRCVAGVGQRRVDAARSDRVVGGCCIANGKPPFAADAIEDPGRRRVRTNALVAHDAVRETWREEVRLSQALTPSGVVVRE